ncbi:Fic family protein [Kluyvera sichuanensis]|uniref:Fic family protein n=1 Tax=Kluyvera sichuanensis TaxID=2725494 RepID=UPI0039F46F13
MWIWQQKEWPAFHWDRQQLSPLLRETQFLQGTLYGSSQIADAAQTTLDAILANIIYSSDIEGEKLNAHSVRSSLAVHLGVQTDLPYPVDKKTEGLVESALDAINNLDAPLNETRLLHWHRLLFPENHAILHTIVGGKFRDGPVQVVSGRIDKPVIHFEGPEASRINVEISAFTAWFNESRRDTTLDPLLRAGIAHLWFLTIHPFEDGNGRIGRLIMDLALAQAEQRTVRLYAMSRTINERRKAYYEVIEKMQKGELDITVWLTWFLNTLKASIEQTQELIAQTVFKAKYWRFFDASSLNAEQVKVLNRMLDGDFELGINNTQYKAVAGVSRATATRHLAQLCELGFLQTGEAGGRSVRYKLPQIS